MILDYWQPRTGSHVAPTAQTTGECMQFPALQESVVHGSLSLQFIGVPPPHVPLVHV